MKILYHKNCNDGSGAALAAWLHLRDTTSTGESIDYVPVQYGTPPPDCNDEEVFILDFSYPRDVLLEMAHSGIPQITVIDHHKSAAEALSGDLHPNIRVIFDMEKSGAVLTWEHFHSAPVPVLLLYIQDRDLWRFTHAHTKPIAAALQLYPNFRHWQRFVDDSKLLIIDLIPKGMGIIEFLAIQTAKTILDGPQQWDVTGAIVPLYNLPGFMISDTLHAALEKYPEALYAVSYFDLPEGARVYSLRSRQGSDVDVSEIAISFGGGGHKHAAGFKLPERNYRRGGTEDRSPVDRV